LSLRRLVPVTVVGVLVLAASTARATDHDNVDAGRPLRFDDADPIAFRERDLEFGVSLSSPRGRNVGLGLAAEYLVGFALNSHLIIGLDPTIGGRVGGDDDDDDTRFDIGDVSLGVFHNFNREYGNTPAFAVRGDVALPTGRGSRGAEFRLRGIVSRSFQQYARLHLNVDATLVTDTDEGEKAFRPALTLGYTRPLGYPTRFDRTGLAEVSVRADEETGRGTLVSLGLGLRQQVTPRSVVDVGLQSDVGASGGASREDVRAVAGYSTAF
jgi:hypothetical protein